MPSNLDRHKKDLDGLITRGEQLHLAIQAKCLPDQFQAMLKKEFGDKAKDIRAALPSFAGDYQAWYSEAKALVKQRERSCVAQLGMGGSG